MLGGIRTSFGVLLAGMAAAASSSIDALRAVGKGVAFSRPPADAYQRGVHRCRDQLSRPSRKQEIKDWGRTRSWTGQMNRDNPPGTKLRKKVTKQQLTVRKGW